VASHKEEKGEGMKKLIVVLASGVGFLGMCAMVVFLQYLCSHPEEADELLGTEEVQQSMVTYPTMKECAKETRQATPNEIKQLGWSACTATICDGRKWEFHVGGQACAQYRTGCGSDPRGCNW